MPIQAKNNLVERLFKSGAHFGFSKSRRHPSVVNHIYGTKNGSDIIDIEKTAGKLEEVKSLLHSAGRDGKVVLFVGTKDEVSRLVKSAAENASAPFVYNRWIGGMLTNFSEIKKRIKRFLELKADTESGELDKKYTKKERLMIAREIEKLDFKFGGIQVLEKIPELMVVVDPRHDEIAVAEALELNIPVVAIMSSDCDAGKITYPILVNDSLTSSVKLVLTELSDALKEGKAEYKPKPTAARRPVR